MSKTHDEIVKEVFDRDQKLRRMALEFIVQNVPVHGNRTTLRALQLCFIAGYEAAKDQLAEADNVINSPEKLDSSNSSNNSNGWISVKDRLPEIDVGWTMVYGCILSRWWVQPGFYDNQRKEWISRFIDEYEDDEGYARFEYARFESVTHWMPLPEAPKEEK